MSQVPGLFRLASPVSVALVGGQAPACWQREIARSTARLDALPRTCAWVAALAAIRPRLRGESLLGHYLETLTDQIVRPTEPKPKVPEPRRRRFTWPEHPLQRARDPAPLGDPSATPSWSDAPRGPATARRAPQVPGESPARAPAPFQLESRAGQTLLTRLADGAPPVRSESRPRQRSIGARLTPTTGTSPSVSRDPAVHQDWLHDVARRAGDSLHRGAPDVHGRSRRASIDQPEIDERSSLANQWAIQLDGQPAPADVLVHFAGELTPYRNGSAREAQPESTQQRTPITGPSDRPARPAAEDVHSWQRRGPAPPEGTPTAAPPEAGSRMGGLNREQALAARIAPPIVAPSLPPLLPSHEVGVPSPSIASAVAQQSAREQEMLAAEDDLAELAAKVKRILDEEARRYGIDV